MNSQYTLYTEGAVALEGVSIQGVIGFQCDDGRVFVFTSKKSYLL